ncbi:MAG: peptidoglycan editing factor PgeF [Ruminococcaceae bacterium]|nr:peptidoglycan editing factor PgeF [Oscillospiraceae bacterium]
MNFTDKFYFTDEKDVTVFKSENITSAHAFSTRHGGVSTENPFKSLNLSYGRGDPDENVDKNLDIFTGLFGKDRSRLVWSGQIHSTSVLKVKEEHSGKVFDCYDGFVTDKKGIILSVSVADCTPILLEDRHSGVIGALHAGWRGTVGGIAAVGVSAMTELGAKAEDICVAIGACIHDCCYEVKEDFYSSVASIKGREFADRHIKKDVFGIMHANIVSMNCEILIESGVLPENISVCTRCTCCESDLFFSHRASKGVRGGMKAAIMLD